MNEVDESQQYITSVTVRGLRCLRCDHEWIPRKSITSENPRPLTCPSCHSSYWFRPRTRVQKPKVTTNGLDNK